MELRISLINKIPQRYLPLAKAIAKRAVLYVIEDVQNNIKINLTNRILAKRSGKLLMSWSRQPVVKDESGGTRATLSSNLVYARIHEGPDDGGEFTEIRPVRARKLRFEIEGRVIYADVVRIPARRYISLSLEATKPKVDGLANRAILDEVRKFKSGVA